MLGENSREKCAKGKASLEFWLNLFAVQINTGYLDIEHKGFRYRQHCSIFCASQWNACVVGRVFCSHLLPCKLEIRAEFHLAHRRRFLLCCTQLQLFDYRIVCNLLARKEKHFLSTLRFNYKSMNERNARQSSVSHSLKTKATFLLSQMRHYTNGMKFIAGYAPQILYISLEDFNHW